MEKWEEFALWSVKNLLGEMDIHWPAPLRHGNCLSVQESVPRAHILEGSRVMTDFYCLFSPTECYGQRL